LPKKLKPTIL